MRKVPITFEFPDGTEPKAVWLNYVVQGMNGKLFIGIRSVETKEILALREGALIVKVDEEEKSDATD